MPIDGARFVAGNIIKFGKGFVDHVNVTMRNVQSMMDVEVTKNISLTDHSLKDLAKLGHPYSLKSGQTLHDPNFQVHTQSGKLLSAQKSGIEEADITAGVLKTSAWVKLDQDEAPHAIFVVYGTSKMIPRPVLSGSRDNIIPDVLSYMKSNLKNLKVALT